jgi:hypothetical protein
MNYNEAMKSKDKDKWDEAVFEEHECTVKRNIWKSLPRKELSAGANVISSTWAMNKASNGKYRARLNVRGY